MDKDQNKPNSSVLEEHALREYAVLEIIWGYYFKLSAFRFQLADYTHVLWLGPLCSCRQNTQLCWLRPK
jgi:hypothetical protein